MASVTNVIVLARWIDRRLLKPFEVPSETRRWSGALANITGEDADRYWVHDGKGPTCEVWVGAFNHFHRKAFLEDLERLPWEFPECVQVLLKGQDDDCFGLWMFADGRLQEVPLPGRTRQPTKYSTLEYGQWIEIETGFLESEPRPEVSELDTVAKFVRLLKDGGITLDQFRYKVLLAFAQMPETQWSESADAMPPEIAADFRSYVDKCLTRTDFMPSPTALMLETKSKADIEQMKRDLRPKYIALHQFWQSRG